MGRFNDATKRQKTLCAAGAIAAFIVLWFFATNGTELGVVLAGPVEVFSKFFSSFVTPLGTHTIPVHILFSLSRVLVGFAAGSILGVILGVSMGHYRLADAIFRPIYEMIRPIPPIAWIPLAILWFGLGEVTKYFLIFLAAFGNVTMNAYSGVKSVDPTLMGAAKMLGASDRQVFTSIVLPACVPHIFAGLQIALGSAWATVVAAEMVRSSEGVGWVIITGQDTNNSVQILVGIIAVGAIGYLLAILMRGIETKLCAWSERGK